MTSLPRSPTKTWKWWLVSSFWLLIALASWLEMWLLRSVDPLDALRYTGVQWLPWVFLTPPIFWLTATHPLEREGWKRTIWIHLAACLAVVSVLGCLAYLQGPPPFPRPGGGSGPNHGPEPGHHPTGPTMTLPPDEGKDHSPAHGSDAGRAEGLDEAHAPGGPGSNHPHRPRPGPYDRLIWIIRLGTFQFPTFWAVLGVAHAFTFYKRSKERERRGVELEAHLTQARLEALRMQLNPHFLFNTLNSIASLVYDDPRAADAMIGSLSDLLRLSLNSSGRQEVSLREELHFLDRYLHIEQVRFGDRLRVEKDIDPESLDAQVPILILQPLVENAVKHGLEARLAPGVIAIAASHFGNALHLQVADTGRGIPAGVALHEGVGLGNTRSRLRELYGKAAALDVRPREGGGFLVEITLPWRAAAATAEVRPPQSASAPASGTSGAGPWPQPKPTP